MTRMISGVVMGAAALAAILWLPEIALRILTAVVSVMAGYEYLRVAQIGRAHV